MNLRLQRGEISLPKDFRFDISANNPFFSNEGSASVPATLPATPGNRRLLESPENHNAAKLYSRHKEAIISHGVYSKRCRLVVDSASISGGITASLALEESELYAEHQDKKLKNILNESAEIVPASALSSWFQGHYTSSSPEWVFLKVAADAEDTNSADSTGSTRRASVVLNETTTSNGVTSLKTSGYTMKVDNGNGGKSTISLPNMYGLTPFLKLHALIRRLFEALGYTVKENIFATDVSLSKIIVLHNTADSMVNYIRFYNGQVYTIITPYPDMVPSMTVGEFIEWLHNKFGAIVSVRNNEVSIRLISDIIASSYDLDLSDYLREEITVQHTDPVMLRTGCQHDIEGSEPAAETLEDLREGYSSLVTCFQISEAEGVGLFHILPLGKFYYRNDASHGLVKVGTDGFDCYREMGVETEELISDDSLVPMIYHNGEYMPYIGETVRRHININDKDPEAEQKMMICYCRNDGSRNFGTLYNYSPSGSELPTLFPDLIPEGMTIKYWEAYRRLKLDGAPTLTAQLDIPLHILTSMDICTPKLFRGAKVLIQSMKYSLTNSGISTCEFTFLRIQEAVDGQEILDPVFGSNLVWEYVNTRKIFTNLSGSGKKTTGYEVTETDGLSNYTNSDKPDYTPKHPGIIEKKRSRWLNYKYHYYDSGFLWESWGTYGGSETYYEYFISKNK